MLQVTAIYSLKKLPNIFYTLFLRARRSWRRNAFLRIASDRLIPRRIRIAWSTCSGGDLRHDSVPEIARRHRTPLASSSTKSDTF